MVQQHRRLVFGALFIVFALSIGWIYRQSLVPAIHPDHDHGLEDIAGGGFLRVDAVEGGRRNLVGRPGRVLILHWFQIGTPAAAAELPALVDYMRSLEGDSGIEFVLVATGINRKKALEWARGHGIPTAQLYADPEGKTASLIGARRFPETLIYDKEGHLAHQARGPMNWADPQVRASVEGIKQGAGEHQH